MFNEATGRQLRQDVAVGGLSLAYGAIAAGKPEVGVGPVRNLSAALAAHRHVGRRNFRLLIDTMQFVRHGGSAAEVMALDPNVIGYLQLCDVPLISKFAKYMEEALHERMVPGTGELPLLDILAALPDHLVLGLEVPQRSLAQAGMGPSVNQKPPCASKTISVGP
jgi:sugar phosphate isomerase/epimerase